jgi:hypothetical protein
VALGVREPAAAALARSRRVLAEKLGVDGAGS